ncbi:polysaccharide deacetylase family protein [Actinomadura macrotermitis]|uniref:NodB homology domain-containing protein n=1 Tax=Actinomadura macrotermitis TaxID=2585200 RepID=A0A7K0BR62_9ACTN|nr:hypothetical protein [Actinomadura macrotermitis]
MSHAGTAPMPLILMYHSVDHYTEDPHLVTVTPQRFQRQMDWLRARGWRGVSVGELLEAQERGAARGLVGLTFDDGYADFAEHVVPTLQRVGFTGTVFVVAGEIGATNRWDTGPRKALMTTAQLRAVAAAGMEVGCHGDRHLSLPGTDAAALDDELNTSRDTLQNLLQRPVTGFAYPYGHAGEREIAAVRDAGYGYACAIRPERAGAHALARTYVGDRDHRLRLRAKVARHQWEWKVRV